MKEQIMKESNQTKLKIKEAVVVEGKYDKIKLSSMIDTMIVETGGFHIFQDPEQLALIRRLAGTQGVIILTDSDGAGFVIRNYLTGAIPNGVVKHGYIPDLYGKEKRKTTASKEGKLGVEGIPKKVLLDALCRAGATFAENDAAPLATLPITKAELFELGITGGEYSGEKRKWLLHQLQLPERMTTNAMLRVINESLGREAFFQLMEEYAKEFNS